MNIDEGFDVPGEQIGTLLTGNQSILSGKRTSLWPYSGNRGKGVFPVHLILTDPLLWQSPKLDGLACSLGSFQNWIYH